LRSRVAACRRRPPAARWRLSSLLSFTGLAGRVVVFRLDAGLLFSVGVGWAHGPGEQRGIQPRRFSHRHRLLVLGAAFSRDNSRIVTASADSTARIWDAATGAALATLRGHTGAVAAAAFGPDGSRIVTASADRTARIWQLDPLVLMPADQRQSYICRERLIGARSFTAREMEEPMLRGRDDLRQPCDRLGPFSLYYYRQSAARAGAALRRAFSN
jgi:hypothetical protein